MALARIPTHVQELLKSLHEQSATQEAAIPLHQWQAIRDKFLTDPEGAKADIDTLMVDKFIALDEDKCHFAYTLLLGIGAKTVGISTIYLALAVAENAKAQNGAKAIVIATEKESSKAAVARENWDRAGPEVDEIITLKEGDLRDTLTGDLGVSDQPVDFVLLDIWPYVALPALQLIMPRLRRGAIILTDNIIQAAEGYGDLIQVLRNPAGPFRSVTLPYKGGMELSIYSP
ncbi:uncharacterized protein Z518_03543 [Rhinocladiella mackenziei CBS 650.93]|uniref:O-methyltransferase n=1 Tax=Rhinocladiella mackenziei CBS 650.93 TaxID=1442369 RepID=A0A0D2IZQ3_9EURO|nr:uncharacterized protein Z518_03543 [Rhinocladiella mackenziei CBS 650.93]KIX08886.1 hypothetical protein Z518_03543 [Rhinocladiella mackenziei CBS 650.93]